MNFVDPERRLPEMSRIETVEELEVFYGLPKEAYDREWAERARKTLW